MCKTKPTPSLKTRRRRRRRRSNAVAKKLSSLSPPQHGSSDHLSAMFAAAARSAAELHRRRYPNPAASPPHLHPAAHIALMKSHAKSGHPEETLQLLPHTPPHRRRRWSLLSFNTALNAAVNTSGAALEVSALLDQMSSSGLSMDASTHNILLKLPSSSPTFARKVFDSMSQRGLPPSPTTFSTLISHLSKSGKINDACSVLNHMIRSGRRPNPFCYTPILQALCSRGRTGEAEALIKAMEEAGCASHTVAKNILLSGFCRRRDFPAAERLLAAPGWRPNIVTFNIFINGLCNAGKIEEAFSQLAVMAAQRLTPSAITINILLRCICHHSGAEEGKKLLDESWRLGWGVNAVDFNAVMSSFSAAGKWAAAPPLLAGMVKMGVKPDARSFNILIFCLCREGKFQKARTILENGGFKANTVTYNILIGGFCAAGHVAAAEELVGRMVEMNVEQDLATWTIRIEWLCKEKRIKEAKEVFRELKRRFLPDLVVFRVLIGGLVGEGDVAGGRRLVREMVGQGLTPDVGTVDFVVRVFCRSGFCGSGEICIIVGEMLSYI